MSRRLQTHVEENVLLLGMTNPPVNSLSLALRSELYAAFTRTAYESNIHAIVLYGAGKYFCAGGDLRELGTPASTAAPRLSADILGAIEACPKPVIAAVHGAAIGGGFELALACHYRIADSGARIALPEVVHGIIPLSATLRLPKLWGMARALPMMLDAQALRAEDFRHGSVFDYLIAPAGDGCDASRNVVSAAMAFVRSRSDLPVDGALVRHRSFADSDPARALSDALAPYATSRLSPAQEAVVAAIRAGIEMPDFDGALAQAQGLYDALSKIAASPCPPPMHMVSRP